MTENNETTKQPPMYRKCGLDNLAGLIGATHCLPRGAPPRGCKGTTGLIDFFVSHSPGTGVYVATYSFVLGYSDAKTVWVRQDDEPTCWRAFNERRPKALTKTVSQLALL